MKIVWYSILIALVIAVILIIFRKKAEEAENSTNEEASSGNLPELGTGTAEFIFKSIPKTVEIYK